MEVEKRAVKGGFFQLFDWNGKSRKKLFSGKSELPESSNQGKENYRGSAIVSRQQGLEKEFPPNGRGYSDYHYASSASGDSEYGTKAPGVVARLMGLDSLPVPSNVNEPCLTTPFIESNSFRDSSYLMAGPAFQNEHDIVIFESVRNKLDGSSRNPLELRLQKMQSQHLERFQREALPPKSAKPISVTHHRLLSPIKSPGFIPPKNAAYIIEAASKIMEQSPRSTSKVNFPSIGSSSVPFRVRDLKQKIESAQKGREQNSKNTKRQLDSRGKGRLADSYLYQSSEESKSIGSSQRLKNREKSSSLAVQAKTNIQKKDGFASAGNRSSEKQREHSDVKHGFVSKDLTNTQKKVEKKSSSRRASSEVLRLNNQKQNCVSEGYDENPGPSCSKLKERKESNLSSNYVNGRTNRTVNKIVVGDVATSRRTNFVAADPGKEVPLSRPKTNAKKKLSIDGSVTRKAIMEKDEKSVKRNVAFEGDAESEWDGIDKKSSLDVVSFTFTSPIKKSGASSSSCNTILEANSSSFTNSDPCVHGSELRDSGSYSSRFNVIGGDTLSLLLEQKLKELSSKIELSQKDMSESAASCSSSVISNSVSKTKEEIKNASIDKILLKVEKENKEVEYIEEGDGDDNSNIEYQRYLHLLGSLSASNQPLSGTSSDSFDLDRNSCNEGRLPYLSVESYEGISWSNRNVEVSDTASVGTVLSETVTSGSLLYLMDSRDSSSNWELRYIRDILSSAELFSEEFALGQAHKIIAPDLFDELENQRMNSYKVMEEEQHMLERKVLFDGVCECLEQRCGALLTGSWKSWAKQMRVLGTRQFLADDLYREVSSWKNVEELMMDELVDKDMSCKNGKWTDFETEAFEEGVEIEERILTCLVDELIDDFFL
ncbi:hypothetical protein ACP275_02G098600 [Erythranthe tilingii]